MKQQNQTAIKEEHLAKARASDLHISTKHSVEICRYLRYKTTNAAKKILDDVIALKKPVPFKRYKRDVGHKPGMAAGRYPQKAAKEILRLIKTVEANAQFKGLNTSNLKIIKILANKASIPLTGGRHRNATKRTNLEVETMESREKKKGREKSKPEEKTEEIKKTVKVEAKPEVEKEEIVKENKVEEVEETKTTEEEPKTTPTQKENPQKKEEIKKEEIKPDKVKEEIKAGEQEK
jgi:large subunit ribosomal protein L22